MAYKTDFLSQWNNVISAIKVEMNKQLDYLGKIKVEKLNEAFNLQTQKWSSGIIYEGKWLANMEDEEFSRKFLNVLHRFKFSEVTVSNKRSVIGYLIPVVVGVGSFLLIKYIIHMPLFGSVAIAAIVLILGIRLNASFEKKKMNEENENIKAAYIEQLKVIENELVALCQKYDN